LGEKFKAKFQTTSQLDREYIHKETRQPTVNWNRPVARNVVWRGFECRRHSNGGAEGADEVGSGEGAQKNFGIFSFEMVHFDTFWRTFGSTVIVTMMFMTSAEV